MFAILLKPKITNSLLLLCHDGHLELRKTHLGQYSMNQINDDSQPTHIYTIPISSITQHTLDHTNNINNTLAINMYLNYCVTRLRISLHRCKCNPQFDMIKYTVLFDWLLKGQILIWTRMKHSRDIKLYLRQF